MEQHVDITFDCLPLRTVVRVDMPIDASPGFLAKAERLKEALKRHGQYNTYYLHNAKCVFHLTNDPNCGMIEFRFEGTVLTDPGDRQTLRCDLEVALVRDTCEWLTEPIVAWYVDTVRQAVRCEFDRYIAAGDLQQTIQRLDRIEAESDAQHGFMGMGL